tara:strand:+ start:101 stop:1159 length:1059 start_codon:yes stop_codon:yes gene_type:complete
MTLFTLDIGQGKAHIYDSDLDKHYEKRDEDDLINLNIPGIKTNDIIVVEDSHMRESHRFTMAQPYTYDDLKELERNSIQKGVSIYLFPQKKTPVARKLNGYDDKAKSDKIDVESIAKFLKKDQGAFNSLKPFNPIRLKDYQNNNKHIFDYIQEANADLNPAKSSGYGFGKNPYEDDVSRWIKKYELKICEYLDGDLELMNILGFKFDSKNRVKVDVPMRAYTIIHSFIRPNNQLDPDTLEWRTDCGGLRLRGFEVGHKYYGERMFPNWKFVKSNYFGCKPFHFAQGVAASNYKHWMRKALSDYKTKNNSSAFVKGMEYDEYFKIKEARSYVDEKLHEVWSILYKMIIEDGLR